jgi:hypothetical protein
MLFNGCYSLFNNRYLQYVTNQYAHIMFACGNLNPLPSKTISKNRKRKIVLIFHYLFCVFIFSCSVQVDELSTGIIASIWLDYV